MAFAGTLDIVALIARWNRNFGLGGVYKERPRHYMLILKRFDFTAIGARSDDCLSSRFTQLSVSLFTACGSAGRIVCTFIVCPESRFVYSYLLGKPGLVSIDS